MALALKGFFVEVELDFVDEGDQAAAVVDEAAAHLVFVGLDGGIVEDDGDVGFDGDAGVVAGGDEVFEDFGDFAHAFAGHVVVGVVFGGVPRGVLDVDV